MARKHHGASETGGYRGSPETEHETITDDRDEERPYGRSCDLRGEMIGLGPDELLLVAKHRLKERDEMIERLLRHLPRKYEERVKALETPHDEANTALQAVALLLGNARLALDALSPPTQKGPE